MCQFKSPYLSSNQSADDCLDVRVCFAIGLFSQSPVRVVVMGSVLSFRGLVKSRAKDVSTSFSLFVAFVLEKIILDTYSSK